MTPASEHSAAAGYQTCHLATMGVAFSQSVLAALAAVEPVRSQIPLWEGKVGIQNDTADNSEYVGSGRG